MKLLEAFSFLGGRTEDFTCYNIPKSLEAKLQSYMLPLCTF